MISADVASSLNIPFCMLDIQIYSKYMYRVRGTAFAPTLLIEDIFATSPSQTNHETYLHMQIKMEKEHLKKNNCIY